MLRIHLSFCFVLESLAVKQYGKCKIIAKNCIQMALLWKLYVHLNRTKWCQSTVYNRKFCIYFIGANMLMINLHLMHFSENLQHLIMLMVKKTKILKSTSVGGLIWCSFVSHFYSNNIDSNLTIVSFAKICKLIKPF